MAIVILHYFSVSNNCFLCFSSSISFFFCFVCHRTSWYLKSCSFASDSQKVHIFTVFIKPQNDTNFSSIAIESQKDTYTFTLAIDSQKDTYRMIHECIVLQQWQEAPIASVTWTASYRWQTRQHRSFTALQMISASELVLLTLKSAYIFV